MFFKKNYKDKKRPTGRPKTKLSQIWGTKNLLKLFLKMFPKSRQIETNYI